ncbi:hypothetical protein GIB67_010054 [Kingdonia uniflora]|uniref:GATA-type domain-containing protein n=1 Tax=Kingdonia uniflora TaxID=39325 RepID=A0A7J7KV70_9MAGN|nr:hypothetical protein GIB67_010054 [Kingdonia uniflora]
MNHISTLSKISANVLFQEVDVSLEWLSIFVEDCLSSTGICIPPPAPSTPHDIQYTPTSQLPKTLENPHKTPTSPSSLQEFSVPGKARSKRKRATTYNPRATKKTPFSILSHHLIKENQSLPHHVTTSDPLLLHQTYWLADSEFIVLPKKEENINNSSPSGDETTEEEEEEMVMVKEECWGIMEGQQQQQQPRRCTHCLSQKTPQWRAGPLGPKTLCNACGVRFKSGRLLPEYRPAKSPTFVSYKHSNSHKKVMEMRMTVSDQFE